MKINERCAQVVGAEVRPQHVEEAELGVGRLPEQEIRQPLLAAGANEKIDISNRGLSLIFRKKWGLSLILQQAGELLARGRPLEAPGRRRVGDGVACRIVDRDPQMEARASG